MKYRMILIVSVFALSPLAILFAGGGGGGCGCGSVKYTCRCHFEDKKSTPPCKRPSDLSDVPLDQPCYLKGINGCEADGGSGGRSDHCKQQCEGSINTDWFTLCSTEVRNVGNCTC